MKHYIYGSGMPGCMFDYGPHCAETREQAIESILCVFGEQISVDEERLLREDLSKNEKYNIHYFNRPSEIGATYCSVSEYDGPCPEEEE